MLTKSFEIKNPTGLHARPAGNLCALSKRFASAITITCGDKTINPRSVVSILLGSVTCGKTVEVLVDGEDEALAMEALADFLENLEE